MRLSHPCPFALAAFCLAASLLLTPVVAAGDTVGSVEPVGYGVIVTDPKGMESLPVEARLDSWELVDSNGTALESGQLASPIDLEIALITALPRGQFVLRGTVEGEPFRYEVPASGFKATVRPDLRSELATINDQAWATWDAHPDKAARTLLEVATLLADQERRIDAGWIALDVMRRSEDTALRDEAFSRAEEHLSEPIFRAHLLRARGRLATKARQSAEATQLLEQALALDQQGVTSSLLQALDDRLLGGIALDAGDFPAALEHWSKSLEIRRRLAPRSWALWSALFNHFIPLYQLGRLEEARQDLDEALRLAEMLAPDSIQVTITLSGLGNIAWQQGDLRQAQALFEQAQPVLERLAPDSPRLTEIWNNLGLVAHDRGNLSRAETYFRRALDTLERIQPGSIGIANALNNLGMVANERGALDDAEAFYDRALEVYEALHADSLQVARTLNNRANNARRAGRLEAAVGDLQKSQEITTRIAPESKPHATGFEVLALVLEQQGDFTGAHQKLADALLKLERIAPESLRVARPLHILGRVLRRQGDTIGARKQQERALSIVEDVAPASALQAQILNELGRLDHEQGHPEDAVRNLCRAADSLDDHKLKLGGNRKAGNPFGREVAHFHRDCIEALLALGRTEEAYAVLERSRARELLALLAERDLVLDRDLPANLRQQQQALYREYDKAFSSLQASDAPLADEERAAIQERLLVLRRELDELDRNLRAADPRLAALESPQPLDADAARRALDPGTLLLAYSLGETHGHMFALAPDKPPRAYPIAAGHQQIDEMVAIWRDQIAHRDPRTGATAQQLWRLLIAPVTEELTRYKRVLISPQGSLNTLPFAALLDPSGRYLIEHLPIHVVASTTLYAELRRPRSRATRSATKGTVTKGSLTRGSVIAFADPQPPSDLGALTGLPNPARTSTKLPPLPGTRREVQAITTLFPDRSRTFVGEAASESELKRISGKTAILHLATHGYLDPEWPLDSGLVLSASESEAGDNGLLQAWEVFEELSIEADLVTLSACETGLGKNLPGEGLIGLTRAFQYAGARSILASLWQVTDASTARLMERFYRELEQGAPKDEALRTAQLELLQTPTEDRSTGQRGVGGLVTAGSGTDTTHPFAWAGFQLIGDR